MESFRHTYQTIWQVGALFTAISAGVLAFASDTNDYLQPWLLAFAPVPFLFWFFGVFLPMDNFGEVRLKRLVEIEEILRGVPGLEMKHYQQFDKVKGQRRPHVNGRQRLQPDVRLSVCILATLVFLVDVVLFLIAFGLFGGNGS